jgi:hypothetical protein
VFVRAKRSVVKGVPYEYLQIVRNYRDGGKVRQQVLGTLGRRDLLAASGEIDGLLKSLGRFSENLKVVERVRTEALRAHEARTWGPALVFGRLWETQGLPDLLDKILDSRRFEFDVERVAFAMALQRLCRPGSDLQGSQWIRAVEAPGMEELSLHHFYRTAGFLSSVRARLERDLFFRDRDLFSQSLDLVFIDTTSTYVYADVPTPLKRWGYSRDRRGDLLQVVLCVVVDGQGWPIAWEILPGNTADKVALHHVVEILRERFDIRRVVVVADRGMIAKETIQFLTQDPKAPFQYVLGCRLRKSREVRDEVLTRIGCFESVAENLQVQEVVVRGRRYVLCHNPIEAKADAQARKTLVAKLEKTLHDHGPKSVIGNRGFARFVRVKKASVEIDREAVERDALFDGKFVLTTDTDLPTADVARAYKNLWRVERTFREEKSTLQVRPIYHQSDRNCTGHIVASFLALRLEVDLQRRLDAREVDVSWPDLMRDLSQVQAVVVELDGQKYRLRTDLVGRANAAFVAAGVRPPSPVTRLEPSPTPSPEAPTVSAP